ncbi:MAG: hypothetical protein HZA78_01175 [Candidatus Schekmanbacteria bacterium]|nr:hypothetical protein [Candidatus Schekmanbacteria bacterium]
MDTNILVAIISASSSIAVASLTYYLTKRMQTKREWQLEKINHYKVLMSALSDLAVDGKDKNEANERFSLAVNTICLVASQQVITALMEFHNEIKFSNLNFTQEKADFLLIKLLLAIRKDIGLSKADNEKTFNFHLIGAAPPKNYTKQSK